MTLRTKTAVAAGFVLAVGVAATAFGQTGGVPSPAPSVAPSSPADRPALGQRPERRECGRPAQRPARRPARRLVHSETKVQMKDDFAILTADRGVITNVDPSAKTVTIRRADDQTVTVTASDETKICKDGKPAGIGELKTGDHAGILQSDYEGKHVVRRIAVRSQSAGASTDDLVAPDLAA